MSSKPGIFVKSRYIDTLDSVTKRRYEEKLSLIGGLDPYELSESDWTSDRRQVAKQLPNVTYIDIVNYLLFKKSAYTSDELKAFKSLDSYNHVVSGWVRDVRCKNVDNNTVVTAKVRHSQRVNETPLRPWVIASQDGIVHAAHCTCMAGLGEVCSHVAALLFGIDSLVRDRNSKTVTQEPAYWLVPNAFKDVEYSMVKNIDFSSARKLKRNLDAAIETGDQPCTNKNDTSSIEKIASPSPDEMAAFYGKLMSSGDKPVVLSVVPGFAENYVPTITRRPYPTLLTDLYDDTLAGIPQQQLEVHCEAAFESLHATDEEIKNLELLTREQSQSKDWFSYRAGRVTASKMKLVCATSLEAPSKSLVTSICYPSRSKFKSLATDWGVKKESTACDLYCAEKETEHDGFSCTKAGFFVCGDYPFIGASPDGLVACNCCGEGTLEIKCPFSLRDTTIGAHACLREEGGQHYLRRDHPYYFQVQTQMFVCKKEWTDFVMWTECDLHIERIEPDPELWEDMINKAGTFFRKVILPELCTMSAVQPQPHSVLTESSEPTTRSPQPPASNPAQPTRMGTEICMCRKEYDSKSENLRLIDCANENCQIGSFHFGCVGVKRARKAPWFCFTCRELPQFKKKRKAKN